MTTVVSLFMIVAAAIVIGYPLWKPQPAPKIKEAEPNSDLLSQKEATYAALKELDFDYALGNLTQEDHRELEEKYKDKAVSILKQMDARRNRASAPPAEKALESEIFRLRQTLAPPGPVRQDLEEEILRLRQALEPAQPSAKNICPKCNSGVQVEAKFCSHCGSPLKAMVCAKCSAPYKPGERFCSQCGAGLTEEKGQ